MSGDLFQEYNSFIKSAEVKVCLHVKQISNVIYLIQTLHKNVLIPLPPAPKCYLISWPSCILISLLASDICSNFLLNFQSHEFLLLNRPFQSLLALSGMVGVVGINWPCSPWVPMHFSFRVSTLTSLEVTWT